MNREECSISTFSSRGNNKTIKANAFICRRKAETPVILAQLIPEGEDEVKAQPSSGTAS